MVSTPNPYASLIGIDVLRAGGSAVDAAIAMSAVLMVAVPHQCSPGGDGFWIIRPAGGPSAVLNATGRSSQSQTGDSVRALGFARMPERSVHAVTVPGVVDGWMQAHARFGRLEFDRLLQPAIEMAKNGLAVTPYFARQLRHADGLLASGAETDRLYRAAARPLSVGDQLRLPDLSRTLSSIAKDPGSMYTGTLASRIVDAVRLAGGCITADDLAAHRSDWCVPETGPVGPWVVEECPPNSQGWTALLAAALLEQAQRGWTTEAMIDAAKIALWVRNAQLADPAAMRRPVAEIVAHAIDRIGARSRRESTFTAAELADCLGPAGAGPPSQGDTAHVAVVDRDGLAVSCILSLYFDFGSGLAVPGTGIVLQNRGASFALAPDHPNALAPSKRPMHTLAPALATAHGATAAVFGAMGGDAQVQIHLQLLEGLALQGLDPATVIARPRWFVRLTAGDFEVLLERRSRDGERLLSAGNRVVRVAPYDEVMGHAQVILVDEARGVLIGAADPRSDGIALGW
jgi:gamma-glutamyltranspeptidase/glutathione hydrolase